MTPVLILYFSPSGKSGRAICHEPKSDCTEERAKPVTPHESVIASRVSHDAYVRTSGSNQRSEGE